MSGLKEELISRTKNFLNHKKKITVLAASVAGLFCIGAIVFFSEQVGSVLKDQNHLFYVFTEELFRTEIASNTINVQYTLKNPEDYGIDNVPVTFGNVTSDSTEIYASVENIRSALEEFTAEELSVENQLTYDLLSYYLENVEEQAQYLLYEEPLSTVSGVQTQLPVILSEYPFYDKEDVDTYLELMQTTPVYFESLIEFEQEKAEAGLFMSDRMAEQVIEQCNAFIEMGESNYLISTFVERIKELDDLSGQEKSDYMQKNASMLENYVIPAYENLVATVQELKGSGVNEGGLCWFTEGKEYYEMLVQNTVGTERTVEEMRELTRNQMIADLEVMESIINGSENTEIFDTVEIMSQAVNVQDAAAMDSANPITILNTLEEKIEKAFPEPPQTAVSVKYVPEALQEHLSPAFYMIPAIDNYDENVIYVNQSQMGDTLTLFTTLAHEGYPGHLYQTTYFADTNPNPVRNIFSFGGYVEGWATYAEMCSYYLAPVEKEQAKMLQKYSSVILGVYTLADIGIHYDGWSREDTLAFYEVYGISDAETVDYIYDLIIGCPGNYLKYYIGYVEFLELKKQWIEEKGEAFSQVEFHEAVLDIGPAPFEIVEEYMWQM